MYGRTVVKSRISKSWAKKLSITIAILMLSLAASCASDTANSPTSTAPSATPTPSPTITPTGPTTKTANIVEVAASNASLKTITAAIQAAGLTSTLQGKGPFTVFAPTDQAFASIPAATRQRVLQPENRDTLARILSYHVIPGELTSSQLQSGKVKTVEGKTVDIQVNQAAKQVTVNEAQVTQPDIRASNGVIHVVDRIILPPGIKLQ